MDGGNTLTLKRAATWQNNRQTYWINWNNYSSRQNYFL